MKNIKIAVIIFIVLIASSCSLMMVSFLVLS